MQKIMIALAGSLIVLIAAVALLLSGSGGDRPAPEAAINIEGADLGGPFELVDQTGTLRSSADILDKPSLVYFGYTFCPDVCPVDTQVMVDAVDEMAKLGVEAQPVFITIDPERDDVEIMSVWAEIHHPDMIALTGSAEQIATAAKGYKAFYQKVESEGEAGYLMNHSAYIYLVDQAGVRALYRRGFAPELIAQDAVWALEND